MITRSREAEKLLHEVEERLRQLDNNPTYKKDTTDEEKIKLGELADEVAELRIPIEIVEHK